MTCKRCDVQMPSCDPRRRWCSDRCKEAGKGRRQRERYCDVGVSGPMHLRIARAAVARGVTMREFLEQVLGPALGGAT